MTSNLPFALAFGLGAVLLLGSAQGAPAPRISGIAADDSLSPSGLASTVNTASSVNEVPKVDGRFLELLSNLEDLLNEPPADAPVATPEEPGQIAPVNPRQISTGTEQKTVTGVNSRANASSDNIFSYQISMNKSKLQWTAAVDPEEAASFAAFILRNPRFAEFVNDLDLPVFSMDGTLEWNPPAR